VLQTGTVLQLLTILECKLACSCAVFHNHHVLFHSVNTETCVAFFSLAEIDTARTSHNRCSKHTVYVLCISLHAAPMLTCVCYHCCCIQTCRTLAYTVAAAVKEATYQADSVIKDPSSSSSSSSSSDVTSLHSAAYAQVIDARKNNLQLLFKALR
jgi:hypothetical protein